MPSIVNIKHTIVKQYEHADFYPVIIYRFSDNSYAVDDINTGDYHSCESLNRAEAIAHNAMVALSVN